MKRTKRIFAIFMTLALAMSMLIVSSAVSFAAGTYTVADPSDHDVVTGHTYKAYQIFTGTYNATDKIFNNIKFSSNVTQAGQTALLNGAENAKVLAKSLGANDSDAALAFAKLAYANKDELGEGTAVENGKTVLGSGLWLIVDETTGDVDVVNWANLFASDGTKAVSIVSKVDAPSSDKKIKETNDTTGYVSGWQDAADYDIGDAIPFKLTATLPSNYTDYTTYHLTFHDKQSAGLSFNADSVKVYVGEATTPVASSNYTVKTSDVGTDTFQILFDFEDLTAMNVTNGSVIRVEYTATLTGESVVYGQAGNPNTSWITYDNNPNSNQDGEEGGKTPEDTVIAFTYKTIVNKQDEDKKALTGANFTLYKEVPSDTEGATLGSEMTFTDGVEHSAIDASKYYKEVTNKTGDATGSTFSFNGIDEATYVLVETTVPAGYNPWKSAVVTVDATYTDDNIDINPANGKIVADGADGAYVLTELKDSGNTFTTVSEDNGTLSATIENKSGAELPSTGGIGTIIFYVLGSLLVVGCGIVLISKRRMESR